MRNAAGGKIVGSDYFGKIMEPFNLKEGELEMFLRRILKVISLFLKENGDIQRVEKSIIFQTDSDALSLEG